MGIIRRLTTAIGAAVLASASLFVGASPADAQTDRECPATRFPDNAVTISNLDGHAEQFWVGESNDTAPPGPLWHVWQTPSGTWSNPVSLGGWLTSYPNVERNADGRLEVFARALGGDLAHIWQLSPNAGAWSSWTSLGGSITYSGAWTCHQGTGLNRRINVYAYGPDGLFHRRYQTAPNCCWSGWVF